MDKNKDIDDGLILEPMTKEDISQGYHSVDITLENSFGPKVVDTLVKDKNIEKIQQGIKLSAETTAEAM